jgi:hypothetical protein
MSFAPKPLDDDNRLSELWAYEILDSPVEKDFDDLLELAALFCGCPMATITFIDKERQWFKSMRGMPQRENNRFTSFCAHTILQDGLLVVEDAQVDSRFAAYPDVCGGQNIRFYAGVPITTAGGFRIGSICVMDHVSRQMTPEQLHSIEILSVQVSRLLELRLVNIQIQKHANLQVQQHKVVLQSAMKQQDRQRMELGEELHENVAQVLASTLHFLDMAIHAPELRVPLIQKSHKQILAALHQVRGIAHAVNPFPVQVVDLSPAIREYLDQYAKKLPFPIHFESEGNLKVHTLTSQALFVLLDQLLQLASLRNEVEEVEVQVAIIQQLKISFRFDGKSWKNERARDVMLQTLQSRMEMYCGTIDTEYMEKGQELLLQMPLNIFVSNVE